MEIYAEEKIRHDSKWQTTSIIEITPQAGAQLKDNEIAPQVGEQLEDAEFTQQVAEKIENDIFSIPWGHHKLLIDKFREEPRKALFYAHESLENGWNHTYH